MVCQSCKYILGSDDPSPCVATNKQRTQFAKDCQKYIEYKEEEFKEVTFDDIMVFCQKAHEGTITKRKTDDFCKKCPLLEGCL